MIHSSRSSPVMFSIKYSKQFLSYRILKSNRFKYIWRYGLGLRGRGCAQGGVCVLYRGRLVIPTVLRKAERRLPQQDLESLVSESNGRIGLHGDANLRKYDATEIRHHRKSLVRRIFRGQGAYESLRKKFIAKQTELVMMIDDLVVKKIFNQK